MSGASDVSVTAKPERVHVLGLPVDRITMAETLGRIRGFLAEPWNQTHLIITADAVGLVQAQHEQNYHKLYAKASIITPDSVGVLWAAKRGGTPLPERVSGVDLVGEICAISGETGCRIFFLGASPGVAELAAEKLRLKYPGCNIVGTRHGYFSKDDDQLVAKEIAEFTPDVLFVAMGIPRQELFIDATAGIIRAKVAMGVGGSLDVFSGRAKRAPKIMQMLKLEWAWRLILNPKKIDKAKYLPEFVRRVLGGQR
ncbi:MAG: WecB/TagA/CpsF family glycosyltransferase [Fimbriimonas sp.]